MNNLPDIQSVEATARALWPRTKLNLTGEYIRMLDATTGRIEWCHPDPLVDKVLRMKLEALILKKHQQAEATKPTKTICIGK